MFAPWPPAPTGIADYAVALLDAMRRTSGPHTVEREAAGGEVAIYHLGNNPLHAQIYARSINQPGVVILHDALLQHLFLGALKQDEYVREFTYNYGGWHADLARELYRNPAASALRAEIYRYPMLRRAALNARAVVVHNPAAARVALEHAPEARVECIPHLWCAPPPPSPAEVLRFRRSLGLSAGDRVFGLYGYLRESKRLEPVLEAFRTVHAGAPHARLIVAGDFVSADLPRAVAPLLEQPGVVRLGHLDEATFWLAAEACDAAVNLRWPSAGETSGITVRLMGLGKPVLLSDLEENRDFPETACVRIGAGLSERAHLIEAMRFLLAVPEVAHQIGLRARAYIHEVHDADRVAAAFWRLLESL